MKAILFKAQLIITCTFIFYFYISPNFKKLHYKNLTTEYQYDPILELILRPVSKYLTQHFYLRDLVVMIGSISLDFNFSLCAILYIFHGRGTKIFIMFAMFYGYRAFLLNIFDFVILEESLANMPGLFSIWTPFHRSNDFYYSGHTGCAFLLSLFHLDYGHVKLFKVGCIITIIQGLVMMIIRLHFFIDIIIGLIFSHYFFIVSTKIMHVLNSN